jgi:cobalamin synthase
MTRPLPRPDNEKSSADRDPGAAGNVWNLVILVLVAAGLIAGLVLTSVKVEPFRSASFWLLMLIGASMIVSAVCWGYTETRNQERLSRQAGRNPSDARRILGYVGALIIVAVIAVAGSMVPSRFAPAIWAVYVPIWLVGGWWLGRKRGGYLLKRRRR